MKTGIILTFFFMASVFAEPWARHTIDASEPEIGKKGADGVRLGDVDGDGLLDVVTGWEDGRLVRICRNPGPEKSREPWPATTIGTVVGVEDACFADLDGNGKLDVVSCAEGKTKSVFFHWNRGERWETVPVPTLAKKASWMFAFPFDVNGDGHLDVICAAKGKGAEVGWIEGPHWEWHSIAPVGWVMSLRVVDGDLIYSDRKGERSGIWKVPGIVGKPELLGAAGEEVMFIDVVEDKVFAALRPNRLVSLDGMEFEIDQTRFGTVKSVRSMDVTGDGEPDLVATCERATGQLSGVFYVDGATGKTIDIGGPEGVKFDRTELLDLDGDGDLDIMTCEERDHLGVIWYENPLR